MHEQSKFVEFLAEHLPWFYAMALSLWGGVVQYAQKVRSGEQWSWATMALDIVICSFAGLIAFFVCQAFGVSGWQQAIVISVSAHEGTRAINVMTRIRDRIIGSAEK